MSYPSLGKMLGNLRNAYHPDPDHAIYRTDGQGAPEQTEPLPSEPEHIPHTEESKAAQEIRLALAPLHDAMEHLTGLGSVIGQAFQNVQQIYAAPLYETASLALTHAPYIVQDKRRNHVAAFVATAQTVNLMIPGVGSNIAYNLAVGWNQLDFPPLTEISTANATAFNVLFLYSMDRIANA